MSFSLNVHDVTKVCIRVGDTAGTPTLLVDVRAGMHRQGFAEDNTFVLFCDDIPARALDAASKAFNEAMKGKLEAIRTEQIADAVA